MVNQVNPGFQQPSTTTFQTGNAGQAEENRNQPRATEPQAQRDGAAAETQRGQEEQQFRSLENNNQINERREEAEQDARNTPRGSLVDIEA